MIQNQGKLKAILLTHPEAEHIKYLLKTSKLPERTHVWLTHPSGEVIFGTKPASEELNPQYNSIIEQIRYYQGNLQTLQQQDLSTAWIMHDLPNKLAYLDTQILPYREHSPFIHKKTQGQLLYCKETFNKIVDKKIQQEYDRVKFEHTFPQLNKETAQSLEEFVALLKSLDKEDMESITTIPANKFSTPFYFNLLSNSSNQERFQKYLKLVDPVSLQNLIITELDTLLNYKQDPSKILSLFKSPAVSQDKNKQKAFCLGVIKSALNYPSLFEKLFDESIFKKPSDLIMALSVQERKKFLQGLSKKEISVLLSQEEFNFAELFLDEIKPEFYQNLSVPNTNSLAMTSASFQYLVKHAPSTYLSDYIKQDEGKAFFEHIKSVSEKLCKEQESTFSQKEASEIVAISNLLEKILPSLLKSLSTFKYENYLSPLWNLAFLTTQKSLAIDSRSTSPYLPITLFKLFTDTLPRNSFTARGYTYGYGAKPETNRLWQALSQKPYNIALQEYYAKIVDSINSRKQEIGESEYTYENRNELINAPGLISLFEEQRTESELLPELYYQLKSSVILKTLIKNIKGSLASGFDNVEKNLKQYLAIAKANPKYLKSLTNIIVLDENERTLFLSGYIQQKGTPNVKELFKEIGAYQETLQEAAEIEIELPVSYELQIKRSVDKHFREALEKNQSHFRVPTEAAKKMASTLQDTVYFQDINQLLKIMLLNPGNDESAKFIFKKFKHESSVKLDKTICGYFNKLASPQIQKLARDILSKRYLEAENPFESPYNDLLEAIKDCKAINLPEIQKSTMTPMLTSASASSAQSTALERKALLEKLAQGVLLANQDKGFASANKVLEQFANTDFTLAQPEIENVLRPISSLLTKPGDIKRHHESEKVIKSNTFASRLKEISQFNKTKHQRKGLSEC